MTRNENMSEREPTPSSPDGVTLAALFWTFFRVGLFTLGGGLAMAAVLRHELVLKRRWIRDDEFMSKLSTATLVPGVIAVNVAYLQGRRLRGKTGSALAIAGTILPSFVIILLVAWLAWPYFSHPKVAAFLRGCAIAVAGQLAFTAYLFGRRRLRNVRNILVCAAGLAAIVGLKLHPLWAVLITAGLGYFLCVHEPPKAPADPDAPQADAPPSQEDTPCPS